MAMNCRCSAAVSQNRRSTNSEIRKNATIRNLGGVKIIIIPNFFHAIEILSIGISKLLSGFYATFNLYDFLVG